MVQMDSLFQELQESLKLVLVTRLNAASECD